VAISDLYEKKKKKERGLRIREHYLKATRESERGTPQNCRGGWGRIRRGRRPLSLKAT